MARFDDKAAVVTGAARAMKAAGRGGVIVNMASIPGVVGFSGAPAYTKAAARELAPDRIPVVAVCPAFIRTRPITGQEGAVLLWHPIGGYTAQ